jgi:UPF0755 protein
VLLAAGAGGWWWYRDWTLTQFSRTPFGSSEPKLVDIPPKTGPKQVSNLLARASVVSSSEDLYRLIRREQLGPRLKAGEYEFSGALTPEQVIQKIASGQVKQYHFTVPEGLRVEEILDIVSASELKLDRAKLEALLHDPTFLRTAQVPAKQIEGFLFPDTYTFTHSANEEAVLAKMVSRALEEYRKFDANRSPEVHFGVLETFTLASIIEKETGAPEERARISCVFHNRLRQGIKLQTDPTVLYAMKLIRGRYINNITSEDLRTEHPYNTYTTYGLPPGPIASPGAAAIEAALHPLNCKDLYFVSKNDGSHIFCPDLKCHNAAVEVWQKEYFRKQRSQGG